MTSLLCSYQGSRFIESRRWCLSTYQYLFIANMMFRPNKKNVVPPFCKFVGSVKFKVKRYTSTDAAFQVRVTTLSMPVYLDNDDKHATLIKKTSTINYIFVHGEPKNYHPDLFTLILYCRCSKSFLWWRHQMETFSALLALCAGNSPVPGEFPSQRSVTRSFVVSFDLRLNKQSSKQ